VKTRFVNPYERLIRRSLKDVLLWKSGFYKEQTKKPRVPETFVYPLDFHPLVPGEPTVLWINHSTFLISAYGVNVLTDPIWSDRCSPLSFIGPKRRHAPAFSLLELPRIDYVLISHDHYDHLDRETVEKLHRLFPEITWLVPQGVGKWFSHLGITQVVERKWWESVKLKHFKATAVPAQHFSGRRSVGANNTLWAGWVIEFFKDGQCAKRMYFVGDSGYNPYDFKAIGKTFGKMDLSLIPIGCYEPRSFMAAVHMNPVEAVRVHQEVGSKLSIGMHFKTFCLSDESMDQPPFDLLAALKKAYIDPRAFLVLDPGYKIQW